MRCLINGSRSKDLTLLDYVILGTEKKGRGQGGREGAKQERKGPGRKGRGKEVKEGAREERKGSGRKGRGQGGKGRKGRG